MVSEKARSGKIPIPHPEIPMWYWKKPMWYRYFRCGIGIFPLRAFSDTTSEIISNRACKEYANCSLWVNESNGDLIFNERSTYLKDWPPIQVHFQLLYTKNLKDDSYMELDNINVDPCSVHKLYSGYFILRSLLENYEKTTNSKDFGCPNRKVEE